MVGKGMKYNYNAIISFLCECGEINTYQIHLSNGNGEVQEFECWECDKEYKFDITFKIKPVKQP